MKRGENEYVDYLEALSSSSPPCTWCKHFRVSGDQSGEDSTCDAFPEGGIPSLIFRGIYDHRVLWGIEDHGITFEPYIEMILDGKKYLKGWKGLPIPIEEN